MGYKAKGPIVHCEVCGSTRGYSWFGGRIKRRIYADGLYHELCASCLRKREESYKPIKAEATRKRKKTIEVRGAACQKCGKETNELHQHHIKRVLDGGGNDDSNLLLLCIPCHKKEHHRREWAKGGACGSRR